MKTKTEFAQLYIYSDSSLDYLRHLVSDGLAERYAKEKEADREKWEEIQRRAEYELNIISNMGFTGCFLIVADFVNWAREHDIPVGPGRRSVASSIVAFALRITDIDPIKYDLLFECFINPERISMSYFDIDFSNEGRDKVIEYVSEKYGKDKVGRIVDFRTFHAKMYSNDMSGTVAVQYNTDHLETCGLVEFDFNSFELLDVIKHTGELIRRRGGEYANFSIDDIPEDDRAVFTLFSEGDTDGVFLFDSDGMKDILKQAEPQTIHDLMALNALYRPGPMENIQRFIGSKEGFQIIVDRFDPALGAIINETYGVIDMEHLELVNQLKEGYLLVKAELEDILKETYGIIVYHEQVMRIIQRIAGYTLGAADILRRIMWRRDKDQLEKEKAKFLDGAVTNGFKKEQAADFFDVLAKYAAYSFNKSHAAAYTKIAYQTAYLKANFPVEFMAANIFY